MIAPTPGCRQRLRGIAAGLLLIALAAWTPLFAQSPDPQVLDVLSAVVEVRANVPASARTAAALGTERVGSGVVIDAEGLIVTIGYLILEATEVVIATLDGKTVPARIVAYDHETGFGLLRAGKALTVKPMALGNSADVAQGDPLLVTAFGGAGVVRPAVVVSRREFAGYWEYLLDNALFTSPPYPMFGGAALMNSDGHLVGIGSLVVGDAMRGERTLPGNMFVPIDQLKSVLGDLLTAGRSTSAPRAWIGVYSHESPDGLIVVQHVAEDGPASKAGIQPGDVIVEIDGRTVSSLSGMYRELWDGHAPGDRVRVTILRGAERRELSVLSADRYRWLRLAPPN
ncbi:MAG: S1C family serine protease [Gammaproteobacteria bacterium]|nr:S1C family serine protease [Gammaproteobacteria bacterium]